MPVRLISFNYYLQSSKHCCFTGSLKSYIIIFFAVQPCVPSVALSLHLSNFPSLTETFSRNYSSLAAQAASLLHFQVQIFHSAEEKRDKCLYIAEMCGDNLWHWIFDHCLIECLCRSQCLFQKSQYGERVEVALNICDTRMRWRGRQAGAWWHGVTEQVTCDYMCPLWPPVTSARGLLRDHGGGLLIQSYSVLFADFVFRHLIHPWSHYFIWLVLIVKQKGSGGVDIKFLSTLGYTGLNLAAGRAQGELLFWSGNQLFLASTIADTGLGLRNRRWGKIKLIIY